MLSIGEFSRITGLTTKTIRLYGESGLLPPAAVSADFESCFPVRKTMQKEGVVVHKLEGGRCVSSS